MRSKALTIVRMTLNGGDKIEVRPDRPAMQVNILNATAGELQVHSCDDDDTHYLVISAGFERALPKLHNNNTSYCPDLPSFWLKPVQSGSVVLIWT